MPNSLFMPHYINYNALLLIFNDQIMYAIVVLV